MPVFDELNWMEDGPDALDDGIVGVVKVMMAAAITAIAKPIKALIIVLRAFLVFSGSPSLVVIDMPP